MSEIILASASQSRRELLIGAGLNIKIVPSYLDEDLIKAQNLSVTETALKLSQAKAVAVSADLPDQLVIGADQMMECDDKRFDKPLSIEQARHQLLDLRGKIHHLISAVSIAYQGKCLWSHSERATLEMRFFSEEFLDDYIKKTGNDLLSTVGGYRLESLGVQLFSRIEGDYFTILGLPLLAVLDFLRTSDILKK